MTSYLLFLQWLVSNQICLSNQIRIRGVQKWVNGNESLFKKSINHIDLGSTQYHFKKKWCTYQISKNYFLCLLEKHSNSIFRIEWLENYKENTSLIIKPDASTTKKKKEKAWESFKCLVRSILIDQLQTLVAVTRYTIVVCIYSTLGLKESMGSHIFFVS